MGPSAAALEAAHRAIAEEKRRKAAEAASAGPGAAPSEGDEKLNAAVDAASIARSGRSSPGTAAPGRPGPGAPPGPTAPGWFGLDTSPALPGIATPSIVKENPADLEVRVPLPQRSRHWEGTTEAKELQRSQAAQQIALARGMDTGGRGMRMGGEAAARSHVESQAPIAMIREAEDQGYTKQEANAAGLLAMDEAQFMQTMAKLVSGYKRSSAAQEQQEDASRWGSAASGAAMGASVGGVPGAILGGLGGWLFGEDGGVVPGTGSGDTVPAMLTPGELVIPKELSAQLMEVMDRNAGGGKEVYRAQTGGMVRRDPQTGYLANDPIAASLHTMELLKEQKKKLKALEKLGKGRK